MVWRKTTNKKKLLDKEKPEAVPLPDDKMLAEYFESLVLELNFRLLACTEFGAGNGMAQMLWVDGITLTAYEPGITRERNNFLYRIKKYFSYCLQYIFRGWYFKRLISRYFKQKGR